MKISGKTGRWLPETENACQTFDTEADDVARSGASDMPATTMPAFRTVGRKAVIFHFRKMTFEPENSETAGIVAMQASNHRVWFELRRTGGAKRSLLWCR